MRNFIERFDIIKTHDNRLQKFYLSIQCYSYETMVIDFVRLGV